MNKKFFLKFFLLFIAILSIIGGRVIYKIYQKNTQPPVSIIIASDMHYLSPIYRGDYFKEPNAMFDGKLIHYSSEYFDAFLAEVIEKHPQTLILSGDITLNGSLKSHDEVVLKLKEVQAAGIDVLVIPGNHDVNSTAGDYTPESPIVVESADYEYFSTIYEEFGPKHAISRDENSFSYVYEASPYLRILMIDANAQTKGLLSDSTLNWVEQELKQAKEANVDVIAVTHQNLHIHNELLYFSYQLYNADKLLTLYETYDVKLSLSGHVHIQSIVEHESIPEVAVGSLAICGTPYGELTYNGKEILYTTVKTDVSSYASALHLNDENLLDFNNYSTWYFEEVGRLQNYASFAESGLSEEDIHLLANTFAKINAYYFLGESFDSTKFSDGIALWQTQKNVFTLRYIETMLKTADEDNQTLSISLD